MIAWYPPKSSQFSRTNFQYFVCITVTHSLVFTSTARAVRWGCSPAQAEPSPGALVRAGVRAAGPVLGKQTAQRTYWRHYSWDCTQLTTETRAHPCWTPRRIHLHIHRRMHPAAGEVLVGSYGCCWCGCAYCPVERIEVPASKDLTPNLALAAGTEGAGAGRTHARVWDRRPPCSCYCHSPCHLPHRWRERSALRGTRNPAAVPVVPAVPAPALREQQRRNGVAGVGGARRRCWGRRSSHCTRPACWGACSPSGCAEPRMSPGDFSVIIYVF